MRRGPLFWPANCVAGLCIGAGAHLLGSSPIWGVFGLLIGGFLAYLNIEATR